MSHAPVVFEDRNLTPDEVEHIDSRRRRGHLYLIIGLQALVVTTLVSLLWVGQDLVQGPGWLHPVFYWACITGSISIFCFLRGLSLRRGFHEFTSY